MSNVKISPFIIGFIIAILGIVAVTVIAGQISTTVSTTAVTNESLSIAGARIAANNINPGINFTFANSGLADAGGIVSGSVVVRNASGFLIGSTNYSVNQAVYPVRISFLNTTFMVTGGGANNGTLVDYNYYPAGYLQQSFARNTLNLTPGLYGLLILIGTIALLYIFVKEVKE